MGIKRIVDTQFWTDDKVIEMFSPEDKLFMLYLMTNPHTTQLGIYEVSKKYMSFETGYSVDAISVLIERFDRKYDLIKYSERTKEVAIKNYLRHSIIKGGKPVEDLLIKEIKQVKDGTLLQFVHDGISSYELNETVKKILPLLNQNDNQNDNDNGNENDDENDNDNDVSLTNRQRIVNESSQQASYEDIKNTILSRKNKGDKECEWCKCKTSVLHKHHYPIPKRLGGTEVVNICSNCHHEFHVHEGRVTVYDNLVQGILTSNEYSELCESIGQADTDYYIQRVKAFIEKNPDATFNNVKATILKWHREDQSKPRKETSSNPFLDMLREEGGI